MSADEKAAIDQFKLDVVEPSMTGLVILYFTAAWCGPCKALGPVLEKVAGDYAMKGVSLVKYDVDANPVVAAQFRIQSIPTVYAVFQGQIVGDLTPARSEGQLTRTLDQLLKQFPVQGAAQDLQAQIEPLLAIGEEALSAGDGEGAAGVFAQILDLAPDNLAALGGLARALVVAGRVEEAENMLAGAPDDPALERARAAVALAKTAVPASDLGPLEAAVTANPDDHQARFELANAQMGSGQRDGAADNLLHIIAADREWNDGAARAQLLKLFDVVGLMDPWVSAQRRRLSAVLFT
ncbi:tetratricopeptide repeat protein [Sphingomonas antarctica]|uniref:tetratricopeptide repeat protein n=1 Tax=Sphingomonas antarctica TaxID=2040274 RepID=UPI0039EA9D53